MDLTPDQRRERTRRIRKKIHDTLPTCIAVVDHIDYVGVYFYPEDLEEAKKVLASGDYEGAKLKISEAPPLRT